MGSARDFAAAEPREVLRELDIEKMLRTSPPPVPWVVEPLLARGCVTMLAGREGRGKSMLALALAAGVGRATLLLDIAGMPVGGSGHVLYVDAENGEHEAHRRVHGLSVKAGTLTYVEADGFDLKRHVADLEALVRRCEPKLVVLDSLRSLAPGLDENDSMQVEAALRPVVRLAQLLQIAILILHHASRMSGEYRGSTAIGAAVELGFTLTRHDEDPMAATRRKLACWKCRPAEAPEPRWLTIKSGDDGDILLREAAPYEAERPTPILDELVTELQAWIEQERLAWQGEGTGAAGHRWGTPGTPPPNARSDGALGGVQAEDPSTPPPLSWSRRDFGDVVGRDREDRTLRRAIDRLTELGVIHRNGDGCWQPRAGHEEGACPPT